MAGSEGTIGVQDLDGRGLSLGDRLVVRAPLRDEGGHAAGSAYFECVVMKRITNRGGLYTCTYTLKLDDGRLVLEGLDPSGNGSSVFAVLGGTGRYATARGVATLIDSSEGTEFVVRLAG